MNRFDQSEWTQTLIVRVNDLEMLFMDLQRTVESLDEVVRQQQRKLDTLEQALVRLTHHWECAAEVGHGQGNLEDDKPPHY